MKMLSISVLVSNKIGKACPKLLCNGANRDDISFSKSNTLEDCNKSIVFVEQSTKISENSNISRVKLQ